MDYVVAHEVQGMPCVCDSSSLFGEFCYARYIMISPLASRLGLIFFNREVHG